MDSKYARPRGTFRHGWAAWLTGTALLCFTFAPAGAQTGRTYTAEDYTRAAALLPASANALVDHTVGNVMPLSHDRFLYSERDHGQLSFLIVDAQHPTPVPAYDAARMAAALHAGGYPESDPKKIRPVKVELQDATSNSPAVAKLTFGAGRYSCMLGEPYQCKADARNAAAGAAPGSAPLPAVLSPDGKREVFIRNWNLWVREAGSGAEKQLTQDGQKDDGYATDNAGWSHSDRAVVLWSPDSREVATFQQDQRKDGEMYTVSTNVGHPHLEAWKYPLVGDKDVTKIERVIIDVDSGKTTRLQMAPDEHRSTLCDDVSCHGGWDDVQWASDGKTLAFVSTSRDHKVENVRIADAATGAVREVFSETAPTYFESGYGSVNWRYLSKRKEILWFSQRSNWGNLYLYDATTGALKHAVTQGDWNVNEILHVDEATGALLLAGVGREPGEDPYYRRLYSANLDGKHLQLLTPEDADHLAVATDDGRFLLDVYSTPQKAPVAVLREGTGRAIKQLAKADVTRLQAAGWVAPETFHVKGHDGQTDVYGLLFRPANLDAGQKYPVIDYIYPGPQGGSFGSHSFAAGRVDSNALTQLGFAVVQIEGMGNPGRSKSFHDTYLHDIGINGIPDQISGLHELANRYPWIDLDRTGMWGHSGGGNATAATMFRFPDFIKVGIAESGNHENRNYEDDWDEKWVGLLQTNPDGTTNYDAQANQQYAKNLTGKLMLAHGLLDDNVPVANTMLVVDALEKANKDFDLVLFPQAHHGYGNMTLYMTRRRWDYFVGNLMKATPPREFQMPAQPAP